MSGRVGDLDSRQASALRDLKSKLQDVLRPEHDDHHLLRFLRTNDFHVKKTETLFKEDLKWRAQMRVDTMQDWFHMPEVCRKYMPGGGTGIDKEGHIVWISPMGNIDPKGILYSVTAGDFIRTQILILEGLQNEQKDISTKLGRHIEGVTFIVDLEHLGAGHLWRGAMDTMTELASLFDMHYPDIIHHMFIVRPTKVFPAIYFILKPFLKEDTRRKIKVLGRNWKLELLKYIDADVLPVHWGGTLADDDGNPNMCPSKINLGGKVPQHLYRKGGGLRRTDTTSIQLPGKSSTEVKFKVKSPGSIFRYEFKTESHDMAFGVTCVKGSGEKVTILDKRRYKSHIIPEESELLLDEPGLYIITFDNHGNFMKNRKLTYWMDVIEPQTDAEYESMGASVTGSRIPR